MTQIITLDLDAMLEDDGKRAIETFQSQINSLQISQKDRQKFMDNFMACIGEVAAEAYMSGLEEANDNAKSKEDK